MMDTTSPERGGAPGSDAHPPDPVALPPLLREVFDAAPMLVWVSGPDKLCVWFNQPWLDFTGRTMRQELGYGWTEGVHADDLERCLDVYNRHFDEQRPFRMQYRLRADDGTHRWVDDAGIPRYAADGTFLGFIGACVDIHDARQAEAELSALKQGLQAPLQPSEELRVTGPLPALVARELKTIVTSVLRNLEIAQEHIASGRPREAQLSRAIAEALQAARLAPTLTDRLLASVRRYDSL
jgi:PAS domain S-box-containing protein